MHVELTEFTQGDLTRIRAAQDFRDVKKGTLGGWVESLENIKDLGWVADNAVVRDRAVVDGNATVQGNAVVAVDAVIRGNAVVKDSAIVRDQARVMGDAVVSDRVLIRGQAYVCGDAVIKDWAEVKDESFIAGKSIIEKRSRIGGRSEIVEESHIRASRIEDALVFNSYVENSVVKGQVDLENSLVTNTCVIGASSSTSIVLEKAILNKKSDLFVVQSFGSEDRSVVLYRTDTEAKHVLTIGCWTGTVDTLMDKVHVRGLSEQITEEYVALQKLLELRVKTWTQ